MIIHVALNVDASTTNNVISMHKIATQNQNRNLSFVDLPIQKSPGGLGGTAACERVRVESYTGEDARLRR